MKEVKFSLASKSNSLATTLSYLLSSMGKSYSFGKMSESKGDRFITVNYKGRIKKYPLKIQQRASRIDFYWNTNASYMTRLPFDEVVGECF